MKLTFRKIASETGLSKAYVHLLLTRRFNNPTLRTIEALGCFFKCRPDLEVIRKKYARLCDRRPALPTSTANVCISENGKDRAEK